MKLSKITFTIFMIFLSAKIDAAPSFDCAKAKTMIEKKICENPTLCELDSVLDIIYKKVIQTSDNPSEIKRLQIEWIRNRKQIEQAERTYDDELFFDIEQSYEERIKYFLQEDKIKTLIFNEFLQDTSHVNPYLISLLTLALFEKEQKNAEESTEKRWQSETSAFKKTQFMKLSDNKMLVFICRSIKNYQNNYSMFEITKINGGFKISPLLLPKPTLFTLFSDQGSENWLKGDLSLDPTHKLILYKERKAPYDGNQCSWKYKADSTFVLFDEKVKTPISVKKVSAEMLIGKWVSENNADLDYSGAIDQRLDISRDSGEIFVKGSTLWRGLTPGSIHTGEIEGKLRQKGAIFVCTDSVNADADFVCEVEMKILDSNTIKVQKSESSKGCGGLNASFWGIYLREV